MILLSPFVVVFIYPIVIVIMMYGSAVFLHVYRHRRREIYDAYTGNFWDGAMQTVAAVFDSHGSLWHGKNIIIIFSAGTVILCECFIIWKKVEFHWCALRCAHILVWCF